MSPMYLQHENDFYSDSLIISSSSFVINKMLYESLHMVPIAFRCFCLNVFFLNVDMLLFRTTSAKSKMVSVHTYFSFLLFSRFHNAGRPSTCDMFGHNATKSIAHNKN